MAHTEPGRSPCTPTENTNASGKLGNHTGLAENEANKPAIPSTFGLVRSGTEPKRTRCTPLDRMLQRQQLGTRHQESGTRRVPQQIQGYTIRLAPVIRNKGTSPRKGPCGPNIKKPATKDVTSVRYGASGAPKPAGSRLNCPPRPGQRPGAGGFFF